MMTLVSILIPAMDPMARIIKCVSIVLFTYCIAYGSYRIIERPSQIAIRGVISKLIAIRRVRQTELSISGQPES